MRSMTLMPVSSISTPVLCSVNEGGARWIGAEPRPSGSGPSSSIGVPRTLKMRPRTPLPTGTEIGAPVFFTAWPRRRPSVHVHGDGADGVLTEVLGDLEGEVVVLIVDRGVR